MNGLKWVPWPSAPRIYIDLKRGRKTVITIKRVGRPTRRNKWGKEWQVVQKWVPTGTLPGTLGPVFPTLKAAKQFVEGRL